MTPCAIRRFFVGLALLASGPVHATEGGANSGFGAAAGGGPESGEESYKTDLFTGAATLSIPIVVPPGTNGFQPELALSYSSQRGITWVGQGWDLELPSISRMTKFGIPKFSDDVTTGDYFQLNDDRLVRDDTGVYHTMRESFQRIERIDKPNDQIDYWVVHRTDGSTLWFGNSSNSRIERNDGDSTTADTFRWLIRRAEDRHGNYIEYEYDQSDPGTAYPERILYDQRDGAAGTVRTIEFTLEERQDDTLVFTGSVKTLLSQRLEEIVVKGGASLVTKYRLVYHGEEEGTSLPPNHRSLLFRVDRVGSDDDDTKKLKGDQYRYSGLSGVVWQADGALADHLKTLSPGPTIDACVGADLVPHVVNGAACRWDILDVNGDGASDLMLSLKYPSTDTAHALDLGGAFINSRQPLTVPGLGSVLYFPQEGSGHTGTQTPEDADGVYQPPRFAGHNDVVYADIDGDGRVDVVDSKWDPSGGQSHTNVYLNIDGRWQKRLSGQSYSALPSEIGLEIRRSGCPAVQTGKSVLVDVNGDGRADILTQKSTSGVCSATWNDEKVYINTGDGWALDNVWSSALTNDVFDNPNDLGFFDVTMDEVLFFDYNGDGLTDMGRDTNKDGKVEPLLSFQNISRFIFINTGVGWDEAMDLGFADLPNNEPLLPRDIDGDGLVDQVGEGTKLINTGMSLVVVTGTFPDSDGLDPNEALADINGDGIVDYLLADNPPGTDYFVDVKLSSGTPPGLLTKVEKARGAWVEIDYGATTENPCVLEHVSGMTPILNGCSQPSPTLLSMTNCQYPAYWVAPPQQAASCRLDVAALPFRVDIVDAVRLRDGAATNPPLIREDEFGYAFGRYTPGEREFRGFQIVQEDLDAPPDYASPIAPGDPNQIVRLGTIRQTLFYQGSMLRGAVAQTALARSGTLELLEATLNSFLFTRGDLTATHLIIGGGLAVGCDPEFQDTQSSTVPCHDPSDPNDSVLLSISDTNPFTLPGQAPLPTNPFAPHRTGFSAGNRDEAMAYVVLPHGTVTQSIDGGVPFTRASFQAHDQRGNVQLRWTLPNADDPSDSLVARSEFATPCGGDPNAPGCVPKHLWSLPINVQQHAYGGALLAREQYAYDGLTGGAVTRGDLTQQTSGIPGEEVKTAYHYPSDSFGLPDWISDPFTGTNPVALTTLVPDGSKTFITQRSRGALTETITYDPPGAPPGLGIVHTRQDPNLATITTMADMFGRPKDRSGPSPIGLAETREYFDTPWGYHPEVARATVTISDGSNQVTTKTFTDGLGRELFSQTTGLDEGDGDTCIVQAKTYDMLGRISETSAPYSQPCTTPPTLPGATPVTELLYDARGRTRFVIQRDGGKQETKYPTPLTTLHYDAQGRRRDQTRNGAAGSVVSVTERDGTNPYTTTYRYDPLQRLSAVCDAAVNPTACPVVTCNSSACTIGAASDAKHTTRVFYDSLGRREAIEDPDTGTWTYGYDAAGNLISQLDARGPGQAQSFRYDAVQNRLRCENPTAANCGGADVTYLYGDEPNTPTGINARGRIARITTPEGTYDYQYDLSGNVTQEKLTLPGGTQYMTSYLYDWQGRVKKTTYPDGEVVERSYDKMGVDRVWSTTRTYVSNLTHNAEGRPRQIALGDQSTRTLEYFPQSGYLKSQLDTTSTSTLLDRRYTYELTGRILSVNDEVPPATTSEDLTGVAYDGLGRLKTAQRGGTALNYSYDSIGNLTSKEGASLPYLHPTKPHAVYDTANPGRFQYDAIGNLVQRNSQTLSYDKRGHLTSISGSPTAGPAASFGYDPGGERMRMSRGATLSHFLGPDYEIRSVRLLNGSLQQGRRFVKTIRVEGTVVAVVSSAPGAFAQAPPSGPTARRWILGVGGAPAAVGLGLLVVVLVRRRQLGLAMREPALAGLVALVFYLTPVSVALAAIPDGDVNDDGLLNGADVMLGQRIVDGTLVPSQSQRDSADVAPLEVAPDGTIDASDVLLLTRGAGEEDVDGDGLSDSAELAAGTSPFRKDTDQDGLADGLEPTGGGLNPDSDADGLVDGDDQAPATPAQPIETHWVHTDHLGGSSVVTNASGTVVRTIRYGIFGEIRSNVVPTGLPGPATTSDPREKYTGQRYDSASALYYYGARYYDPALGRFIQADSVVQAPYDPQALNRYSYVSNDPLGRVDPTGYFSIGDFGGGGFWGGVSDFIGGLIPSFGGGGPGSAMSNTMAQHDRMIAQFEQMDRLAQRLQQPSSLPRKMTPAEAALQQRWAQRVAAKMGSQGQPPPSAPGSAIDDLPSRIAGGIRGLGGVLADDLGSTFTGLVGNAYGLSAGLLTSLYGAVTLDPQLLGQGLADFGWSLVPRYGFFSGPGWGRPTRLGYGPFSNPVDRGAFSHDERATRPGADRQLVRDVWSGHALGPYGQVYRVGLTVGFAAGIALGFDD